MQSESEKFLGLKPSPRGPEAETPRGRFTLLALTWVVALVITCPNPRGIILLPYFPLGLMKIFKPLEFEGSIVLSWVVYLILSICVLLTVRKFWFCLVYVVLVMMLLTNAAGCHMAMNEMSKIN